MKARINILVLILFCLSVRLSGQKTSITFRSNANISVRINKPIDGMFNPYFVSDKLDLKPNISIKYEVEVHDFCSIRCEYSNGNFFYILLQEGNNIEIDNINNKIHFKGDNAEGNQYLVDNYCEKGLGFYYPSISSIIKRHTLNGTIDIKSIHKDYQDSIASFYLSDLNRLKNAGKITERFTSVMTKNLEQAYSSIFFYTYESILKGKMPKYKPSTIDSLKIINELDLMYNQSLANGNSRKYYYCFPFGAYYAFKYKLLDEQTKEKLVGKYDKDTFGSYASYLLAPDDIQSGLLSEEFISQLQNLDNYYDHKKMLQYLSEKNPNSEYLPIIRDLIQKENKKQTVNEETKQSVIIDSKMINSLKELGQIDGLKGKCIYIDLWAIFCMPCKIQFQYNNDLHKMFNQYNNLASVYISIDDEKDELTWKKQIGYYHLSGLNLRASKSLYKDIQERIYNGGSCSIPRYILLDANGKVLNNNLPRPQALDKLKEVLDKEITTK